MDKKVLDNKLVERILLEAIYYSQGKSTVAEAAKRFNVSERTFQLDINDRLNDAIEIKIQQLQKQIKEYDEILLFSNHLDLKEYRNKIEDLHDEIRRYRNLPKDVLDAKEKLINLGNIKGGKLGKRTSKITPERINSIADEVINNFKYRSNDVILSDSLRQIAGRENISKSTLYELFMKYLDDNKKSLIISIFEYNKTISKQRPNNIKQGYSKTISQEFNSKERGMHR